MAEGAPAAGGGSVLSGALEACPRSIALGTALGAVAGAGFHALQGPTQLTIGQPDVRSQRLRE